MADGSSTRRRFLVATPPLDDPNFDRTVVFVLEHDSTGAIGVVLNRPTAIDDVPSLERWMARTTPPAVIFSGGPVEPGALIAVGGRPHDTAGVPTVDSLVTIDLAEDPDEYADVHRLRVFSGYSGWGPGQLDAELDARAWLVVDGGVSDVFTADPPALWRDILRRQPGTTAWLADAPDDLSMN